jgi:gamma-glutamyltranspeptidase
VSLVSNNVKPIPDYVTSVRLPWRALFDPVIELCRNGHNLTEFAGE